MSVLSREEFLTRISDRLGEDTSDEAVQFLEDMADTYDDFSSKLNDTTDWKTKYEENDAEWRNKYKERFFSSADDDGGNGAPPIPKNEAPMTFEDLFKEV